MAKGQACLKNLITQDSFYRQFRNWVRQKYKSGAFKDDIHPSSWESYRRQLSRIRNYYLGTGKQSRSGVKAWEKYLKQDIINFINETAEQLGRQICLEKEGITDATPISYVDDITDKIDLPPENFRAQFSRWEDMLRYISTFIYEAPIPITLECGIRVWVDYA